MPSGIIRAVLVYVAKGRGVTAAPAPGIRVGVSGEGVSDIRIVWLTLRLRIWLTSIQVLLSLGVSSREGTC
jgi:hypothetical protein